MYLVLAAVAVLIATSTTQRVARYGPGGMNASMAAMMAAMGTGLSIGYAVGMAWDLAWANLAGVVAGGLHGLWMGRRYGPMAALEGAGGGVMGGLMGPMLAVMLLYLPFGLLFTAGLMLALQAAFSAAAVYLVAAAAGAGAAAPWFRLIGRVLGADASAVVSPRDHYATLGVTPDASAAEVAEAFLAVSRRAAGQPDRLEAAREALAVLSDPVRRARYEALRQEDASCCPPTAGGKGRDRRGRAPAKAPAGGRSSVGTVARAGVVLAGVALAVWLIGGAFQSGAASSEGAPVGVVRPGAAPAGPAASGSAAAAPVANGVQQVAVTLRGGSYSPKLIEVRSGVPVRMSLEAVGDPG